MLDKSFAHRSLVSLEMPPAFIFMFYGFLFCFSFVLLKGNPSASVLTDLETTVSELMAQLAMPVLLSQGFVPLSIAAQ